MVNIRKLVVSNIVYNRDVIKGWTQAQLAEKAKLFVGGLQQIEYGQIWPSDKTIERIAKALGVETYQLYMPEKPPKPTAGMIEQAELIAQLNSQLKEIRQKIKNIPVELLDVLTCIPQDEFRPILEVARTQKLSIEEKAFKKEEKETG